MACMDFVPANTGGSGMFSSPVFANFATCLESANQWLSQNPSARVLNCETLTLVGLHGSRYEFYSELSVTTDHYVRKSGKSSHTYGACTLKGLRIWYIPDNTGPPQRLGYTTLVPALLDASGKPTYEDFDLTIARYNQQVAYSQPAGFVLNIEVVKQPCGTSGKMDPERTCYQHKNYGLNLIRIWFVVGPTAVAEEIGCADFVPQWVTLDGDRTLEDYRTVFNRAQSWLLQQGGIRFTNVQSVHLKAKSDDLDSKRPISHYWVRTEMVQFARVWFVRPLGNLPLPNPPMISHCTLEPAKARTGGAKEFKYETIHQLSTRYYQWLLQCGARVLGIQTFPVPCKMGSMIYPADQARHVLKMNSRLHLRICFDGEFSMPGPGAVPPPEAIQDAGCELL